MGLILGKDGKPLDGSPAEKPVKPVKFDPYDVAFEDLPPSPAAQRLHRDIMAMLIQKFPGVSYLYDDHNNPIRFAWEVQINDDPKRGTITLVNLWIRADFGVIIPMNNNHLQLLQDVYKYAAELLERYRITREKAYDMRENLLGIPRDFRGAAIHQ